MNSNPEIKSLLQKFVLNQCTPEEINEVIAYYKKNQLTDDFPTVEDVQNLLDEMPKMDQQKADAIFNNILTASKEEETVIEMPARKSNYRKYIAIAASVVVLLGIGFFYKQNMTQNVVEQKFDFKSSDIVLQLENGETQIISEQNSSQVKDSKGNIVGNQNGDKLVYENSSDPEKLVYNTIKIPYGKKFRLQLSDGTFVHLNSGTTLKYPVKFIAGENRQVFLDGEAFFDVAKDKKHPFIVNADELNVRVLGTHFNVTNYPEDAVTDVVLVEGSVGMYQSNQEFDAAKNTILKPGFKGSFNKENAKISTKAVLTDIYTSWINGGLTFRNMTFKNIITKLERRYNVTIINKNEKLANEKFNASFKEESIENVMSYFNEIHGIHYTIKNNQILIK
ncbi:ferric-dicitrate binding protein FerR (iron transport regulator) [Flavobacterium nitrogenifigens]|uniref:Ferric-dicitrate binding protein FerR (Iron transport regulator) n=2 Tax=Flavobacterium TaxID=237 RepID=A0A7W7N6P6_9FLAO|nr:MULTISPECIES: FecR family protein [Flavobacterium]MBB4800656.1 ferric-dicitrate binding protein FerR (iron transport regulator) [Flavobacterium nitrogenifigens]MBB6385597.1 ferric-dicitrate binding protein FerR (iron transport regulator) [Flavobacterium notoginsengisoli]